MFWLIIGIVEIPKNLPMQSHFSAKWAECTYCGDSANCLDHVIPYSWNTIAKRKKKSTKKCSITDKLICVPACNECNELLSNYHFHSIWQRAEYLSTRLAKKYKNRLEQPFWSEDELNDVEGRLKQSVSAKQTYRANILNRIRHCNFVSKLKNLKPEDIWIIYESGKSIESYITS